MAEKIVLRNLAQAEPLTIRKDDIDEILNHPSP
jgi:hypothetical protein